MSPVFVCRRQIATGFARRGSTRVLRMQSTTLWHAVDFLSDISRFCYELIGECGRVLLAAGEAN